MKTHPYLLAVLCGAAALLQGCGNDDMPTPDVPSGDTHTVDLTIGCVTNGTLSRSDTPFYEAGYANENTIEDALIIIYNAPLNSTSLSDDNKVVATVYLSSLTESDSPTGTLTAQYYDNSGTAHTIANTHHITNKYSNSSSTSLSIELQSKLTDGATYYAIALANVGDMSSTFSGMTVSALRDYTYTGALYSTGYTDKTGDVRNGFNGCGKFRMTGVNEVKFTWDATAENFDLGTFMVQRLASRIDISFGTGGIDTDLDLTGLDAVASAWDQNFIFPIYDETAYQADGSLTRIEHARFELTAIDLVNVVDKGEYLFEHALYGTHTWLGNENWNSSGVAQNLISSTDQANRTFNADPISATSCILGNLIQDDDIEGDYQSFSVLGYVGENTYTTESSGNKYTSIKLTGKTNIESQHFNSTGTVDENGYHTVTATFKVRHNINSENMLQYGIVRNTIYRMKVRFFVGSDGLFVRWYWYDGSGSSLKDHEYSVNFNEHIIDTETPPTND